MYKHIHEVTLEGLKKQCTHIHYFGLGFIQIKLGPTHRIHFYTNLLPPIVDKEDVHNHRYDFTSTVLYGNFIQELFTVIEGDTHVLEEESCTEGYVREASKSKVCSIEKTSNQHFSAGSSYFISHKTFHRVEASNAITFLSRSNYKKELAEVVKEKGKPNICPFSKKIPENELWNIVENILRTINA